MKKEWPKGRLGEVLRHHKEFVTQVVGVRFDAFLPICQDRRGGSVLVPSWGRPQRKKG